MKGMKRAAVLLLAVVFSALACGNASAVEKTQKNRYNVVFVTDESGSMEDNDQEGLRYEAIRRFVALMTQKGNRAGSVNFNGEILSAQEVAPISGFAEKEAFAKKLAINKSAGYTNTGLALTRAVEMLDTGRDESISSVIILLTDGITEMENSDLAAASRLQLSKAVEQARQAGYQVYTISLNTSGGAENKELKQIASATGGEFREVTSAKDLEEIQTMYYKMIFGAVEGDDAQDIELDEKGFAENEFSVPGIGVEEVNFLLEGKISSFTLTNPEGHTYTPEELDSMTMSGRSFVVAKVEYPVGGIWKVAVHGDPGVHVNFRLIYDSDFYVESSVAPEGDYKLRQKVTFNLIVCDRRGPITDKSQYQGFQAQILLSVNGAEKAYPMVLRDGGFFYEAELKEQGTYHAAMSVSNDRQTLGTETYELNVNNTPPAPSGGEYTAHADVWPILGGSATVDLAGAAVDPDGDEVVYSVESSAFMPEDYTLDGDKLTVRNFSLPEGSFEIRATDPYGAFCTVPVSFTSTNIGIIMAILAAAGILVALAAVVFVIWYFGRIRFMGTITVEKYDWDSSEVFEPVSMAPARGKARLRSFLGKEDLPGFHPGCYFQAGGKDKHIYFRSKKPVYSTATVEASKKIPIDGNGLEVQIWPDPQRKAGISVTFESLLNNEFGN